jgi:nucleoid-associated protein
MPLEHAIAHHLVCTNEGKAELTLRDGELPLEGYSEELFAKLKGGFLSRISREHGSFDGEGESSPLQRALEGYLAGEQEFSAMSGTLLQTFRQQLEQGKVEFNGHLLLFVEKSFEHHLFHLFVAGQNQSLRLNEALEVVPSFAIDTGSSLFGIKVDLAEWKERRDYAYLSLLPPRGNPPLLEAFRALSGFSNGLNKQEATLTFLEGIEAYARELPQEKVDDYRNRVVEYCMEKEEQDAPVALRELAGNIDDIDSDAFVRTVTQHTEEQPEVMLDRRSLRRYVKFAGREKDLAISFNSYQLNKRVHYDAESDTLSINGLPSALRKQLQGHMESGES